MKPTISILGSGNSGHALAAAFASNGFDVTLVSMQRACHGLIDLTAYNKITTTFQGKTDTHPLRFTNDLRTAMKADIVLCSMPATYHEKVVKQILPFVRNGQYIYFSSYFGASRMLHVLKSRAELYDVTVVESMSAIHAARSPLYGHVEILAQKDTVPVAAYPKHLTATFIDLVSEALPCLIEAPTILATSFNNVGPILHVPLMLFNVARIESKANESWSLYHDGLTESVIRFIKELDQERQRIARKLDVLVYSLEEAMLKVFYKNQTNGETNFWHWVRHNEIHAHKTIGAPSVINTRYLTEGVYHGLLPLCKLADEFRVPSLLMKATIEMTNHLLGMNNPQAEILSYLSPQMICNIKEIARAA